MHDRDDAKLTSEYLRDFVIFFAVLFFTCVVGIIELLPELEKISGFCTIRWITVSILYFALVGLMMFGVWTCFWLYKDNRRYWGKGGFRFFIIEPFETWGKLIEGLLLVLIPVEFGLLYLVKLGLLQ